MGTNDDFYAKELNLNYFYMHSNSEQKYPKTAIVPITEIPFMSNKFTVAADDYNA